LVRLAADSCPSLTQASVRARAVLAPSGGGEPVGPVVGVAGGVVTLGLTPGYWVIGLDAPNCWAKPRTVEVRPGLAGSLTLEVVPLGRVRFSLREPGLGPAASIEAAFVSASHGLRERAGGHPIEGTAHCEVVEAEFACKVPAATLDLVVHARGFASHYAWDVTIPPLGEHRLGVLSLRPVSSIAGRVRTTRGAAATARVSLVDRDGQPLHPAGPPKKRQLTSTANYRGFYQLLDVPPGDYRIVAEQPGWSVASASIGVFARTETRVDTLVLRRPQSLELLIDPRVAPSGRSWAVEVVARAADAGGFRTAGDASASAEGRFRIGGLSPGPHLVTVHDGSTRWFSQELDVPAADRPLRIGVPLAPLRGVVTLGGQPLSASVTFGGRYGSVSVPFTSDDEGRFEGVLPADASTRTVWDVDVEAEQPSLRRTLTGVAPRVAADGGLEVELALPSTVVKGVVASRGGEPALGALVNCQAYGAGDRMLQGTTDDRGRFEFHGLPEGDVRLTAEARDGGFAASQPLRLTEDGELETRLVLEPATLVPGRVVSDAGDGVPGATVTVAPIGVAVWATTPRRTDLEGGFQVRLPAATREASVSVSARGFAFKAARMAIATDRALVVGLDRLAGTLVLLLDPRLAASGAPREFLVADGSFVPVAFLRGWAAVNAAHESEPGIEGDGRLVLRSMHPGVYSLCVSQVRDSWELATRPMKGCSSGRLGLEETLTLRSPGLQEQP